MLVLAQPPAATAQELCERVAGARLVAQDDQSTFLGIVAPASDPQSIFNAEGEYGSPDRPLSIWNRTGRFGSAFSVFSPHNLSSATPPKLMRDGQVVGYLSANRAVSAITPALLRERCAAKLT